MNDRELDFLADEVLKIERSSRNSKIKNLWENRKGALPILHYHGIPKIGTFPLTIGIELQMWSKILKFDIRDFFAYPSNYLKFILKMILYQYQNFKDDTPVSKEIYLWLGAGFESSIFGLKQIYKADSDPWIAREPLIKEKDDLASIKMPDFYKSGSMPDTHKFYDKIKSLGEKRGLNIIFPRINRGPFGLATELRGFNNTFIDMKEDPEFFHKLMRFIVDTEKNWMTERKNYLGTEIGMGDLWNDEVDSSLFSAEYYKEFILPYEKELANFYGGIRYWHSCANVNSFLKLIFEIPKIEVFDVGPWTDLESVLKLTRGRIPIEVRPYPSRINVYSGTRKEMKNNIDEIIAICNKYNNKSFAIRVGGLQSFGKNLSGNLNKIKIWIEVVREQLSYLKNI
jgi:hypothetical protein